MAEEPISDKIESAIVGLKQLFIAILRTFFLFIVKPSEFVNLLAKQERSDQIMPPNSFLLTCAVAIGFSGTILEQGVRSINFDTIEAVKDLSLSSFLNHSLPVFVIALVASVFIGLGLRKQDAESRRCLKDLNYYFIGFFGISSLIILVLLSLFMPKDIFSGMTEVFILASYLLLAGFVLLIFYLIQSRAWQILKRKESNRLGTGVFAKLALVNGLVIALCIANFFSPLYRYGAAGKLSGTLLDIEINRDQTVRQTVRLTYVVENPGNSAVTINKIDSHSVAVVYGDNERITPKAWYTPDCGKSSPAENFQQVQPGQAIILSSYVCDNRLAAAIRSGFGMVNRNSDKQKALITDSKAIDISLKVRAVIQGKGLITLELAL